MQSNKRADRKVESNDSPEIPDREEASEEPGLPSGKKNIKYRGTDQKARNKTKEKK